MSIHSSTQSENYPISEYERVCQVIAGTLGSLSINVSPLMDNAPCMAFLQSLFLLARGAHFSTYRGRFKECVEDEVMSVKSASLRLSFSYRFKFKKLLYPARIDSQIEAIF